MTVAALLACVSLVGASCERGTTQEQYEDEVNRISARLDERNRAIEPQAVPTRDELIETAASVEEAADALARLDPPKEAQTAHSLLVSGLRGLASFLRDDLAKVVGDAGTDPAAADAAMQRLFGGEAYADLQRAEAAYEELGYDIELFGPLAGPTSSGPEATAPPPE